MLTEGLIVCNYCELCKHCTCWQRGLLSVITVNCVSTAHDDRGAYCLWLLWTVQALHLSCDSVVHTSPSCTPSGTLSPVSLPTLSTVIVKCVHSCTLVEWRCRTHLSFLYSSWYSRSCVSASSLVYFSSCSRSLAGSVLYASGKLSAFSSSTRCRSSSWLNSLASRRSRVSLSRVLHSN